MHANGTKAGDMATATSEERAYTTKDALLATTRGKVGHVGNQSKEVSCSTSGNQHMCAHFQLCEFDI